MPITLDGRSSDAEPEVLGAAGTTHRRRVATAATVAPVLTTLLVACAVGLDNFAAATAIGIAGVDGRLRVRVGLLFAVFEGAAPLVGLWLGRTALSGVHTWSHDLVGGLLVTMGAYALAVERLRPGTGDGRAPLRTGRLVVLSLVLSLDNLVIGFALGADRTSVVVTALTIGIVGASLGIVGLEVGRLLGARAGAAAGWLGAVLLVGVGIGVMTKVL